MLLIGLVCNLSLHRDWNSHVNDQEIFAETSETSETYWHLPILMRLSIFWPRALVETLGRDLEIMLNYIHSLGLDKFLPYWDFFLNMSRQTVKSWSLSRHVSTAEASMPSYYYVQQNFIKCLLKPQTNLLFFTLSPDTFTHFYHSTQIN